MSVLRLRRIATWVVTLGFLGLALIYLNGAFFSAWISGGPPTEHPVGWERRASGQLSLSAACLCLAFGSFMLLRAPPVWRRLPLALLAVGLASALVPCVGRLLLQDQCLDRGGQWSNLTLECKSA